MNINIKKIASIVGLTLLFSFVIFKAYNAEEENYTTLYIIQIGAYKSYDNVIKNTRTLENYIIRKEEDLYKIYIGITFNEEVYNKLISLYSEKHDTFKKTLKITDKEFIEKIENYDKVILNTNKINNINIIIKEELKLFDNFLNKK